MKLMPNESELAKCQFVHLTTHRLIEDWNNGLTTIMLEELASCAIRRDSNPICLWFALASLLIGGVYSSQSQQEIGWQVGIIGVLIFLIVYYFTTSKRLVMASAGGAKIIIETGGTNIESFRDFVQQIDTAKNERYLHNSMTRPVETPAHSRIA